MDHPNDDGQFCDDPNPVGSCLNLRRTLLGKMGLNVNHLEILADDGPFDTFTVVVTTANQEVERHIRERLPDLLIELGLPSISMLSPAAKRPAVKLATITIRRT